jgi:hypothetical protein
MGVSELRNGLSARIRSLEFHPEITGWKIFMQGNGFIKKLSVLLNMGNIIIISTQVCDTNLQLIII